MRFDIDRFRWRRGLGITLGVSVMLTSVGLAAEAVPSRATAPLGASTPQPPTPVEPAPPTRIEPGVFDIPLLLDVALEPERESLRGALIGAQRRLREFALRNGWGDLLQESFANLVRVYDAKARFDRDLLELVGMDMTTELPSTYCAAIEKNVLVSMSPAYYHDVYPKGREAAAFEKLWTHEMAHRLHVRILDGDEAAMGPVWFYEGFAIFAAGQFATNAPHLGADEIWTIVGDPERGDYARYATVFRHFVGKSSLQELVRRAGDEDFTDWLHGLP